MKLGFVQFEPVFGEKAGNIATVENMIRQHEADLWVLPELFATGYQFVSFEELDALAEEARTGETAVRLHRLCMACRCHIVAGFAEADGGAFYNASMLVGPDGFTGLYRKVHLFDEEKTWFAPGSLGFPVFDIGKARVGMMICFDWLFPEAARSLALAGADIIAHPVNLVLPYCQEAMVTRCIENSLFAVTANRVGTEHRTGSALTFTGQSQIVGPRGQRKVRVGENYTGAQVIEVDPLQARVKEITHRNHPLDDRRPEQYSL